MSVAKKIFLIAGVLMLAAIGFELWRGWPSVEQNDELGEVGIYRAWWWQRGVAFVFSSGQGWAASDRTTAWQFALRGYLVMGIDSARFMAVHKSDKECLYLPGMLENFSRSVQRESVSSSYQLPQLVGHDAGATLVYMAHLQAPPLAFIAAVARNPQPQLSLRTSFCDYSAAEVSATGQWIKPAGVNTDVPLRIWADDDADSPSRQFVQGLAGSVTAFMPASRSVFNGYAEALRSIAMARRANPVADLPLVEVRPAKATSRDFAILYSGDGGWRDLDQTLAGVLADKGMPVVGVDVLSYYWHEKSPETAAADLERIIDYYRNTWHRDRVILIGFSFGANVLPFLYNRLPANARERVKLISLLSPERTTAFSVDPGAWLHLDRDGGKVAIAPELERLPPALVQCVFGQEESDDSLCSLPQAAAMQVLRKPGGHHFDENYDALADDVMRAVQ